MTSSALLLDLLGPDLDVDDSALTRAMYAHDASNYRISPLLVVFPHDADEVAHVVRCCNAAGVPITPRGAGTGMAGNTVGAGVVLDFRRHMNEVIGFDADAATVTVEPGVILDELQRAAAPHGLMFGPDPSSHSRASIGGMLGNDACGNHSVAYGRTSDHVRALDLVLADGTRAMATSDGLHAVQEDDEPRVAAIASQLRELATDGSTALATEFERCPRQVSGYALHNLLPERGFDVARMLVGSEGTLAIIVGATLALVPKPVNTQLLVLGYRDLVQAARDVPTLLAFRPAAIEAIDRDIVATMRARRGPGSVPSMPDGAAWLYVEFADTVAVADTAAVTAAIRDNGNAVSITEVDDPMRRRALWQVREDGAGLASNLITGERGLPGWEDAAVPPHRLADYLADLEVLKAKHGYSGVLYGHFGAGCVHIRFNFDLRSDAGRQAMHAFLREAAELVTRHGGSISGEHGDGRARGELLPIMYSQQVIALFARVKQVFDPGRRLNPGIIVDAASPVADMAPTAPRVPGLFALRADSGDLALAASRCVGIAKCVSSNISAMCPSYNVTRNEVDSTRGRARALQDALAGVDVDLSDAVEALDACLSCKACSTDCPTGVDMATYKSEVLQRHYRRRLRPLSHYTLGWLPALLRVGNAAPWVANLLLHNGFSRRLAPLLGITSQRQLPTIASRQARAGLRELDAGQPRALLFIDTFTRSFRPELAQAASHVLAAAGVPVRVIDEGCCGLTWITTGQLETARQVQRELMRVVAGYDDALPVIVLEPSCATSLAHDLPGLQQDPAAQALAARVRTFAQALAELAPDWAWPPLPSTAVLQTHCHERAGFPAAPQAALLAAHGLDVSETVGCCGLAGNFGFEQAHYELSVAVAGQSLLPGIDATDEDAVVLADGFSCQCQIDHLRPARTPVHLAQLLDRALGAAGA